MPCTERSHPESKTTTWDGFLLNLGKLRRRLPITSGNCIPRYTACFRQGTPSCSPTMYLSYRLIQQCDELQKLDWSSSEKMNIPSQYSASILHNTRQFYRTIEEFLLERHLVTLFTTVVVDIKSNYLKLFNEFKVEDSLAAKR